MAAHKVEAAVEEVCMVVVASKVVAHKVVAAHEPEAEALRDPKTSDAPRRRTVEHCGSEFYGSYWLPSGDSRREKIEEPDGFLEVLIQALGWLKGNSIRGADGDPDQATGLTEDFRPG